MSLHPEVEKMIEAGPQRINRADSSYVDANYVKETPEEFARRCVEFAVEKEREACAVECVTRAIDHAGWDDRELEKEAEDCAAAIRRRGKP